MEVGVGVKLQLSTRVPTHHLLVVNMLQDLGGERSLDRGKIARLMDPHPGGCFCRLHLFF
jgi:hypothetical protein